MAEPIIVGADGSVPSARAVAWAADEAARYRRDLRIVHAVENWAFDVPLTAAPGEVASLSRAGGEILASAERVARDRRPEVRVDVELAATGTVRALAERSKSAFELVVGHRGLGGFAGLVLGSVGLGAVRHSACPVCCSSTSCAIRSPSRRHSASRPAPSSPWRRRRSMHTA